MSEASLLSIGIEILADTELGRVRLDVDERARAERMADRWIAHVLAPGRKDFIQQAADTVDREQALAHLGRLRRASEPQRWAAVAVGWHELGFRYDEAAARFHCAQATLSARTLTPLARTSATAQLEEARLIAADLPALPLVARIDDLARRARLRLDTPPTQATGSRTGGSVLTRRERDVLDLLASGWTNGQIAAQLFISTKTASVHVSNILRKLVVTNRVEAQPTSPNRRAAPPNLTRSRPGRPPVVAAPARPAGTANTRPAACSTRAAWAPLQRRIRPRAVRWSHDLASPLGG